MTDYKKLIANLFFFHEPKKTEKFILKENENEGGHVKEDTESEENAGKSQELNGRKKRRRTRAEIKVLAEQKPDEGQKSQGEQKPEGGKKSQGEQKPQGEQKSREEQKSQGEQKSEISKKISDNLEYMKKVYSMDINGDMILREFDIVVKGKTIPAFMLFYDGMVDRKLINEHLLEPLMLLSNLDIKGEESNISDFVKKHLLPHGQIKEIKQFRKVIDQINFGGCGIFIDGVDSAFIADVKGWEHRSVERPNTEQVLRGPQEGFTEVLRVNTALIRKILKDEDLIVEDILIGRRSKTPCSMLYIKDIANDSLVNEVRRRLKGIDVDYVIDSGELEQLIEDSSILPVPQVIATERPDKAAFFLAEGKVAMILNGSPFALIVPTTIGALMHTTEDIYLRFPYSNLLVAVRLLGVGLSLLLPGLYIAVTNFHQEMIPTDLLLTIAASREKVPFPSVVDILIMEISFELIREAGIRIPSPIGITLSIIGALILGQAAVAANIVSPILIIIVAVTGIGSFTVPNFSLGLTFRILRFVYIFLGALAGFLGITAGLFIQGMFFITAKSFGVPIMVPFAPKTKGIWANVLGRGPIWQQESRRDYLNTKDERKQSRISRKWTE